MKKVLFIFLIMMSIFAFSCKKEEKVEVYKISSLEYDVNYDLTIGGRGYYILDNVANYKIQEVYAFANNLDSVGIIQTYEEYTNFLSKIDYQNPFNYSEDFFKENSLLFTSNSAELVVTKNGYRYTPFAINSVTYREGACFICIDYANEFFTSIQSVDAFTMGINNVKKSIQTYAFSDTEKVKFKLTMNQSTYYYSKDNLIFSNQNVNISGTKPMYVYTIGSNSYCQMPKEYVELTDRFQAYPYRNLVFEGGLTRQKFVSMSGTLFNTYEEYLDFKSMFNGTYFPFTYTQETFYQFAVYLYINAEGGYLYSDKGNIVSTIQVESITNGEKVDCVLAKGEKFPYSKAIDVYMIRIPKEIDKDIQVTFK